MKASIKLREDGKPLLRAKLPVRLFGVPLAPGLSVGSGKQELAFHFGTLWEAGPSCRINYKPHDPGAASMVIKAGLGPWGSPMDAPLVLAAEMSLSSKGSSPSFMVHLMPRAGNFSLRRDAFCPSMLANISSPQDQLEKGVADFVHKNADNNSTDFVRSPSPDSEGSSVVFVNEDFEQNPFVVKPREKLDQGPKEVDDEKELQRLGMPSKTSCWNLIAHTGLPLGRHAMAKFRWQVRMPSDFLDEPEKFSLNRLPVLVVDKLSIEICGPHVSSRHGRGSAALRNHFADAITMDDSGELGKVAAVCSSIKRQLHLLYVENRMLRKTMEEMKSELGGHNQKRGNRGQFMVMDDGEDMLDSISRSREEKTSSKTGESRREGFNQHHQQQIPRQDDVAEQLKKAIMTNSKG